MLTRSSSPSHTGILLLSILTATNKTAPSATGGTCQKEALAYRGHGGARVMTSLFRFYYPGGSPYIIMMSRSRGVKKKEQSHSSIPMPPNRIPRLVD